MRELSHIPIQKVTMFCLRGDAVLVFEHPVAGTQLPAGTVEQGEAPREAAAREFSEETGLREPVVGRCIGVIESTVSADRAFVLEPIRTGEDVTFPRGWPVLIDGAHPGDEVQVRHEVWDWNERPPRLLEQRLGSAPHTALTRRVRRHFFLIDAPEAEDTSWSHRSDGWEWELRWAPIDETLRLAGEQQGWLSLLLQQLEN